MIGELVAYYGHGEAAFGEFIARYLADEARDAPGRLGALMNQHGSDKGTWHNYPRFYELLLELLPSPPKTVFEVGIGSNNPQVVGNMGADGVPGASHRAWRDYFPDALIFGADYDVGALFEERGIHSFFLDQYDSDSIHRAWSVMPHLRFDVVIDDGAHVFEANSRLLDATYARMNPGGLYIIEDVVMTLGNLGRFDDYFKARGWDGFLMRLPYPRNTVDNVVAVIRPTPPPPPESAPAAAEEPRVAARARRPRRRKPGG